MPRLSWNFNFWLCLYGNEAEPGGFCYSFPEALLFRMILLVFLTDHFYTDEPNSDVVKHNDHFMNGCRDSTGTRMTLYLESWPNLLGGCYFPGSRIPQLETLRQTEWWLVGRDPWTSGTRGGESRCHLQHSGPSGWSGLDLHPKLRCWTWPTLWQGSKAKFS